jgi:hypothetical protein
MAGLTTRNVNTVAVDPFTGKPIYPQLALDPGQGPPQGTKGARGDYPEAWNSLGEPWPGEYDQTVAQNSRLPDPYTTATHPPSEFSQAYVDNLGAPGTNQSTGPTMATPAERAINDIVIPGGRQMQGPPPPPAGWQPMQWETAQPSPMVPTAAGADPWQGTRIPAQTLNGAPPNPGMVMGSPKVAAALAGRVPQAQTVLPAVRQAMHRQQHPITYDYPLATPGDPSRPQINGTDMAFMPRSVQTSSRWNTGY